MAHRSTVIALLGFLVPCVLLSSCRNSSSSSSGSTPPATGGTLLVPSHYPSIQAAIDAAKTSDTVLVEPGIYYENIDFKGKAITVLSRLGPTTTSIYGMERATVVLFQDGEGPSSRIEGFTIYGGQGTGDLKTYTGGGITCIGSSPTIVNNVIWLNQAQWGCGGGIACKEGASPLITNNVIEQNNVTLGNGGGIGCDNATATIENNTIRKNLVHGNGGGIYLSGSGATIRGNEISGCVAGFCGGGISGGGEIIGNIVSGNQAASSGGGIQAYGGTTSPTVIRENYVYGNQTQNNGGGLHAEGPASLLIVQNVIRDNTAAKGGGVYTSCTILNCVVIDNHASWGGGVHGSATVTNTILRGNRAYISGLQIFGTGGVDHCNVEGGYTGFGNIDADPRFMNPSRDDFHLGVDSPCRDCGNNQAINLTAYDYDGDPRIWNGTVDMGADEFCPGVYYTGIHTPGGMVRVNVVGIPGSNAVWAVSDAVLTPPVSIPGFEGLFHLRPENIGIVPLGAIPPGGVIVFSIFLRKDFPRMSIPTEALLGTRLCGLRMVHIR